MKQSGSWERPLHVKLLKVRIVPIKTTKTYFDWVWGVFFLTRIVYYRYLLSCWSRDARNFIQVLGHNFSMLILKLQHNSSHYFIFIFFQIEEGKSTGEKNQHAVEGWTEGRINLYDSSIIFFQSSCLVSFHFGFSLQTAWHTSWLSL